MKLICLVVSLLICILIFKDMDAKKLRNSTPGRRVNIGPSRETSRTGTSRKGGSTESRTTNGKPTKGSLPKVKRSIGRTPTKDRTNDGQSPSTFVSSDQANASSTAQTADLLNSQPSTPNDPISPYAPGAAESAEEGKELLEDAMKPVNEDSGTRTSGNILKKVMGKQAKQSKSVAGTKTISLQTDQGYNGFSNFQPSGWSIEETTEPDVDDSMTDDEEKVQALTYPKGVGPALIGDCTGSNYAESSPCYGTKQAASGPAACTNLMESASYIGVGFDGRGYYKTESRRASLVQRICSKRVTFKTKSVPDTMTVFSVYDTKAETKTFQSASQYMSYIRRKAGVAKQRGIFSSESYSYGRKPKKESSFHQTETASTQQGSENSFFSMLFINVIHYEISIDEVKPEDLNFASLKDYLSLPKSYYSVGADVKYQNFLLRWGTHYIRSAKFGGQLKIVKTAKVQKSMSEEQFSSIAETEFQAMFSSLQSKQSQGATNVGILSLGGFSSNRPTKTKSRYEKKMEENSRVSKNFRQSEFTHTTVEAQGGTPLIAEALVDFYTPAFKKLYHKWIASIKDYVKPFDFQLKSIDDLLNMNMDSLFPSGNTNFACMKGTDTGVQIMTDAETNKRYYLDKRVIFKNNISRVTSKKVYCKYDSLESFKVSLDRRRMALETAIAVYMAEGPFPTTSDELDAGVAGCEEETRAQLDITERSTSRLTYTELKSGNPFLISFDLPASLPGVAAAKGKYALVFKADRWFATEPRSRLIHLYSGCKLEKFEETEHKVCFNNIVLTYHENSGMFAVEAKDFDLSKKKISRLPDWLVGNFVAKASRLLDPTDSSSKASVPCKIRWLNSHRLDPNEVANCLHFTAASDGHIFVAFSSMPKDKNTWYYLMIKTHGVEFYHAMRLEKRDTKRGMGNLGDKNLFENYFVCVIQWDRTVIMQYGKSDPDSDVGSVYSSHKFRQGSQYNKLSFYAFGAGSKTVSLMDIRRTKKMPDVRCLNSNEKFVHVRNISYCTLDCHNECEDCEVARNNKACVKCRNAAIKIGSVVQCLPVCPPGYILSKSSVVMCTKCEAGTFKANSGNNNCTDCSPGFYSSLGAVSCSRCRPGTYADQLGSKECTLCPKGTSTKGLLGAKLCTRCYPGSYTDRIGSSKCKSCPKGTSTDGYQAAKSCSPCPPGRYADRIGSAECYFCPNGMRSDLAFGSKRCMLCRSGSYSFRKGSYSCRSCPMGTETKGHKGATSCTKCLPGTYSSYTGLDECRDCPIGTDTRGHHGAKSCRPCAPGTFTNNTRTEKCHPCPKGMYTPHSISTRCFKCPNDPRNSTGATTCTKCPPGKYGSEFGTKTCTVCDEIGYQPYEGTSFCFLCAKGWKGFEKPATKCIQCTEKEIKQNVKKPGNICSGKQSKEQMKHSKYYFENNRWAKQITNNTITGAVKWNEERYFVV